MKLRLRLDRLLYGLVAALVLVGGLWFWTRSRDEREQRELRGDLERLELEDRQPATGRRAGPPRFVRPIGFGNDPADERPPQLSIHEPPPHADPNDLDADEAVETVATVLAELEEIHESGRRLDKTERAELYNRASGSLTALSMWVDGSDPRERAALEDARSQMLDLMKRLKLKPPRPDTEGFMRAQDR